MEAQISPLLYHRIMLLANENRSLSLQIHIAKLKSILVKETSNLSCWKIKQT